MTFKDAVKADNAAVFQNRTEFAELHNVKYDGVTYENVPVVITDATELRSNTGMEGIFRVTAQVFINVDDLRYKNAEVIPEQGKTIGISDGAALGKTFYKSYRILNVSCEMGMIQMELGAYDE